MQLLFIFFYKHPLVIFLLPLLLHSWQYTDPSQHSKNIKIIDDSIKRLRWRPSEQTLFSAILMMNEWNLPPLPLPLNDFNISSPSLFPFIDLVITLPRQGFDFSSEEMSENNHFQWQLTLLAPLSLPHWMCSYPLLILFTTHFQTSHPHQQYLQIHHHIITTELYVHHCHVQYQIAKLLKINHLHHQPVEGHPKKAKLLNNPIICKCRMGGIY